MMLTHQRSIIRTGASSFGRRLHLRAQNIAQGPLKSQQQQQRQQVRRYVDARNDNESPSMGIIRFIALAPLGVIGAGVGAIYTSEGVRNAFDERFPTIMTQLRKVLPGIPATTPKPEVVETRNFERSFAGKTDLQQEYADTAVVAESTPMLQLDDKPHPEEHVEPVEVLDADETVEASTSELVVEVEDNDGAEEAPDSAAEDDVVTAGEANIPQEDAAAVVVDAEESSDDGGGDAPGGGSSSDAQEDDGAQAEKSGSVDKSTDVEEEADAVENEEKVDATDSKKDEPDHDPLALGDVPVNNSVAAAKALASTKPVEHAPVAVDVQREVDAINGRAAQRASEKMMQTLQSSPVASFGADLDEENDVTQLKRRIRMLEQLHQERSLSEATRLLESLKQQKVELDKEYEALVEARAREIEARHQQELKRLDDEVNDELRAEAERIKAEFTRRMQVAARAFVTKKQREAQEALTATEQRLHREALEAQRARQEIIQALRMKVAEIEQISLYHQNYDSVTRDTHRRSFAAFKLRDRLESGLPLDEPLNELRTNLEVNDDALLIAALDAVPVLARTDGVPTAMELQRQFTEKKSDALAAALAPAQGGLAGRVSAHVFSALLIRPDRESTIRGEFHDADAPTALERLERAHYLIDQGDLHGSVQQVQLLLEENKDSAAVEVLGSWLDQARARCLVSQAVQILQARAATVAETLV